MSVSPEAQALFSRATRVATTRAGRGIREPKSGIEWVLDLVARTEYATASAFREVWKGQVEEAPGAFFAGLTGQSRISWQDIARDEFGLSEESVFSIPDVSWVPDQIEALARNFTSPAGFVGLGLGIVLDPISWTGSAMITKAGKLARLRRAGVGAEVLIDPATQKLIFKTGKEASIEAGSKMARRWEDFFYRTGRLPRELAETWAEQAAAGDRALLQLTTPWGTPLATLVPGQPFFRAATNLSQMIQDNAQVRSIIQLFSWFGFHRNFMTHAAVQRARMNRPPDHAVRALGRLGRMLDRTGGREPAFHGLLKAESIHRLTPERLEALAGTAELVDRTLGTTEFLRQAADELRGTIPPARSHLLGRSLPDEMRVGLGLKPDEPLIELLPLDLNVPLKEMESMRLNSAFMGLEFRGQFNDGVARVVIDMDQVPRVETIRKSMEELKLLLPKLTDEREMAKVHEALHDLQRALGFAEVRGEQRIWRLIAYGQDAGDGGKVLGVARARTLEELDKGVWQRIIAETPFRYQGNIVAATDAFRDAYRARAAAKGHLARILDERARLAARALEGMAGLVPYTDATAKRVRFNERVQEILERLGSRNRPLPPQFVRAVEQAREAFELEAKSDSIRLLIEGLDPDVLELERIDRLVERLNTTRQVKGIARQKKATVILEDLDEPDVISRIGLGRFADPDMPTIIRAAALELEEINDLTATVETARGLLRTRKQSYYYHARLDDLKRIRWLGDFGKGPMRMPKLPMAKHRTVEGTILGIHERTGRHVFMEDVLSATGLRVVASARAVSHHDFLKSVLREFGTPVSGTPEEILRTLRNAGPNFGIFQPQGPLRFYPTNVISDASLWRGKAAAKETAENMADILEAFQQGRAAEAMRQRGQRLIELTEADIRSGVGISRNVPAYLLRRDVSNHLARVDFINNTNDGLKIASDVLRGVRNTWSRWTLFIFPGYINRNFVGNIANSIYAGMTDPRRYKWAQDIQRGKRWSRITDAGKLIDDQYVLEHMTRLNVIDSGWAMTEILATAGRAGRFEADIIREIQRHGEKGLRRVLDEFGTPTVMRLGMRVNGWVENNAKIALFIDRLLKGDTPELAAEVVRKFLFDYDEIRPFEEFLRTFIFPFYVWSRKNISLQMEFLAKQPGRLAALGDFARLIEAGNDTDQEVLPQWMHESFPIRLSSVNGRGKFQYLTLRNWLPAAELQALFTPGHTTMGMLAPWLRLPAERIVNYNFYFRRPIESFGGQKGSFLYASLRRKDIEFARSFRLLSELDRVLPAPADSPLAPYQAPLLERLFGSSLAGVGLKTYAIDFRRQAEIAKGQHERILRELRIMQNRAKRRRDRQTYDLLEKKIREEMRRNPDVVLPLGITGLPTEP